MEKDSLQACAPYQKHAQRVGSTTDGSLISVRVFTYRSLVNHSRNERSFPCCLQKTER